MKTFLLRLLFLLYCFFSCFTLCLAMVGYPWIRGGNDPYISPYLLYPLALIICASQGQVLTFFLNKKDINP